MIVKWVIFPVALIFMVYGEQLKSMQFFLKKTMKMNDCNIKLETVLLTNFYKGRPLTIYSNILIIFEVTAVPFPQFKVQRVCVAVDYLTQCICSIHKSYNKQLDTKHRQVRLR